MQLNQIRFAGYAGKDGAMQKGKFGDYTTFSIASTKKGKGQEETVTWMSCMATGGWATYAATIKKGDNVYVEGELSVRDYTSKDSGEKREGVSIKVYSMLIGSKAHADSSKPKPAEAFGSAGKISMGIDDELPF